jgi:hypothetical protein
LKQLRQGLLQADFTEAMVIFSEMSEVKVDECIVEGLRAAKVTPPSVFDDLRCPLGRVDETKTPNRSQRFSFLPNQIGMVLTVSLDDFVIINPFSTVIDTRSFDE